jgi:hypothetical protein
VRLLRIINELLVLPQTLAQIYIPIFIFATNFSRFW